MDTFDSLIVLLKICIGMRVQLMPHLISNKQSGVQKKMVLFHYNQNALIDPGDRLDQISISRFHLSIFFFLTSLISKISKSKCLCKAGCKCKQNLLAFIVFVSNFLMEETNFLTGLLLKISSSGKISNCYDRTIISIGVSNYPQLKVVEILFTMVKDH